VAKLTRLAHTIAIQLHLVGESCITCSSHSRRPVRKLLDRKFFTRSEHIYWKQCPPILSIGYVMLCYAMLCHVNKQISIKFSSEENLIFVLYKFNTTHTYSEFLLEIYRFFLNCKIWRTKAWCTLNNRSEVNKYFIIANSSLVIPQEMLTEPFRGDAWWLAPSESNKWMNFHQRLILPKGQLNATLGQNKEIIRKRCYTHGGK